MIKNTIKYIAAAGVIVAILVYIGYFLIINSKIEQKNSQTCKITITQHTTWSELETMLDSCFKIKNNPIFITLSKIKKLQTTFKRGHYRFENYTTINNLINRLKHGHQSPINVVFNSQASIEQLAGTISRQMMFDSAELQNKLTDIQVIEKYNFTPSNFATMFIPNTYQVYWTYTPDEFIERMYNEYNKFWNNERKAKAKALNISPIEVSILASIVEKESSIAHEMPTIAGVYLNRLRINMPLQADPTVIYANKAFSAQRVTKAMLVIDSEYNTYKNTGLPPGPICIASTQSINAVLNHTKHDFLYFCASTTMDGTHVFAKTLKQHNKNAIKYRKELDRRKIFK